MLAKAQAALAVLRQAALAELRNDPDGMADELLDWAGMDELLDELLEVAAG